MAYLLIIICLLCLEAAVLTNQLNANDQIDHNDRIDDDRRIWGYVAETNHTNKSSVQQVTEPSSTRTARKYPCPSKISNPKSPDFSALGRRISETKCYEYILELKYRDDKAKSVGRRSPRNNGRGLFKPSVIGGRDTTPSEFPHMGAIGWAGVTETWVFKCGSSLISSKFVLTAAHCSRASERDTTIADTVPKIVRLGTKNLMLYAGRPPVDANIVNILVHPQYSPPKRYYDIALMELEAAVTFSKHLQPACLWTNPDTNLGKATVTGWGVAQQGSQRIYPELQAAVIDLIETETCDRLLRPSCDRNWCGVQDHQICGGVLAGGVDTCQGDSGGPLQVKIPIPLTSQGNMHHVIGVTSFGALRCARPNMPGVYTRVFSFLDWIETNVWNNCTH